MALLTVQVLIDCENDVFRNITVDTNNTLEELHLAIMHAFEFNGDQMASFFMSDADWNKGEEYALMSMDDSSKSMMDCTIADLNLEKDSRLLYVYDFLKMWCFYVEVIDVQEGSQEFPTTMYSFGEAPKESDRDLDLGLEATAATSGQPEMSELDSLLAEDEFGNLTDSDQFESLDDNDYL